MSASPVPDRKTWTIAEAKARLSDLLRLAREDGPQYIGTKKSFVVISEEQQAALFRVQAKHQGRVIHLADSLIAGAAKAHNLSVVTRNEDFLGIDIEIITPWERE